MKEQDLQAVMALLYAESWHGLNHHPLIGEARGLFLEYCRADELMRQRILNDLVAVANQVGYREF